MTNTEFYQENLIKILESMKSEIKDEYLDRPNTYNNTQRTEFFCIVMEIIGKYLDKAKEIQEINKGV